MKKLIVLFSLLAVPTYGQVCGNDVLEPPEVCDDGNVFNWDECLEDCSAVGDSENNIMYRDMVEAQKQKDKLLQQQQDWNSSAASNRLAHYNNLITQWTLEKAQADSQGRTTLAANIQRKIEDFERRRDEQDSTAEGSPRDEATKLGPQINELSELIDETKDQLGIP